MFSDYSNEEKESLASDMSDIEILTVTDLTAAIKKQLESRFPRVAVRGEISNLKEQSSGHIYFTLKDASSQISAVLFKGSAKGLTKAPKDGDQVVVKGELTVYPPRGNYQLLVREITFAGVGELLLKFHELKLKLQDRGWFSPERKRKLPKLPRRIGVITSPTGAVIQDILHVLTRRFSGFQLLLNPVRVQGELAAAEIAQAIEQFNRYNLADVLIVGRGGGSLEDLWPFNEEIVAAAIVASKIPIISAVGHETDVTIADFVADVRAPTPSAAAEIVIAEKKHLLEKLQAIRQHPFLANPLNLLHQPWQALDEISTNLDQAVKNRLSNNGLKLMACERHLKALRPSSRLKELRDKLAPIQKNFDRQLQDSVKLKRQKLDQLTSHLKSIDPKNLLTKGYCILFNENRDSIILSTKEIYPGQNLQLMLSDGQAYTTVNEVVKT